MLLDILAAVVGPDHCLTDPDLRAGYEVDWTGRYRGETSAVIRPGSIEELSGVLALCNAAGRVVVVQGGNTGLVGGGVPLAGELLISLTRLRNVEVVSATEMRAEAGVRLADLQAAAARVDAGFGVDTAARDSATIGGMIATNAGGMNVVRFGPMADQIIDAGVVLADGRHIPSLRGLGAGDPAAGLLSLLAGSEGILAVVADATMRIGGDPPNVVVAMVAVPPDSLARFISAVGDLPTVYAIEIFGSVELALAAGRIGRTAPLGGEWFVLIECRADDDPTAALGRVVGEYPAVVTTDPSGRDELWSFREILTEAVSGRGTPHKFDVRVPHYALAEVRPGVEVVAPGSDVFIWGHGFSNCHGEAVANLHINVVGEVDDEPVFDVVEQLGGSIAGEHGIGTAKRHRAARARGDLGQLRALKARLDPRGILNPGVLLPRA